MFLIVVPVFLVIFVGCGYGRLKPDSGGAADKLINDYVLYVALPALLFIAVARAELGDLKQWGFILSTLIGIATCYLIATLIARSMKVGLPQSSVLDMSACYGTTGYMGVPILISVYGEQAALPATLAMRPAQHFRHHGRDHQLGSVFQAHKRRPYTIAAQRGRCCTDHNQEPSDFHGAGRTRICSARHPRACLNRTLCSFPRQRGRADCTVRTWPWSCEAECQRTPEHGSG